MDALIVKYVQSFFYCLEHVFLFALIYPGTRKKMNAKHYWLVSCCFVFSLLVSFFFQTWHYYTENEFIKTLCSYMMYFFYGPSLLLIFHKAYEGNLLTKMYYFGLAFCLRGAIIQIHIIFTELTGLSTYSAWLDTALSVTIFVLALILIYCFYTLKRKPSYAPVDTKMCISFIIFFFVLNTLFGLLETSSVIDNLTFAIIIRLMNALVYLLLIAFQINIINMTKERVVAETSKNMLSIQEKQFESYRSSVDYLNVKCHDLKYQLRSLKNNQPLDEKVIEEIDANLATYESYSSTSSQALNIILREKYLACVSKNIQFLSVIESNNLSLLNDADCYALFGNALDNAIEYEIQLPQEERMIRLSIKDKPGILFIHVENYLKEEITLIQGLPKTTKNDEHYHGFGTKSMKMIAEKYHGFFEISVENHLFSVNIGIPVDQPNN